MNPSAGARLWATRAAACMAMALVTTAAVADSCVECHKNPEFRVTNKKLFDYYQDWSRSVHQQEGVTCVDCHGGDATAEKADQAHRGRGGKHVAAGVEFAEIPKTCGRCHADIEKEYEESRHYEQLLEGRALERGPNCVTCHGSLNSVVVNTASVTQVCSQCHNAETANNPEIPRQAERLLGKIVAIHRFHRYVSTKGDEAQLAYLRVDVNPRIEKLAVSWHGLDLDEIQKLSYGLLDDLHRERDKVRKNK